jgi:hypothetical protein
MVLLLARADDSINIEFILLQVAEALSLCPPPPLYSLKSLHSSTLSLLFDSSPLTRVVSYLLSYHLSLAICFLCYVSTWLSSATENLQHCLDTSDNEIAISQNPSSSIMHFFQISTQSSNLASVIGVIDPIPSIFAVVPSTLRSNLCKSIPAEYLSLSQPRFGTCPLSAL